MKTYFLYLLLIISLQCSCNKESEINMLDRQNLFNSWKLNMFVDKSTGESIILPDSYSADITFHGENCIYVIGPCNSGLGNYILNGNKIKITFLSMTERGCEILGYETLFTNNLSGNYIIDGEKLTIDSDKDFDLVFSLMDSTKVFECYALDK